MVTRPDERPRKLDPSRVLPSLGRRTLRVLVGTTFLLASVQGFLFTVETAFSPAGLGSFTHIAHEVLVEAVFVYSIAALVLPTFWLADRLRLASASLPRAILLHVPVAATFVVVQISVTGILWWELDWPLPDQSLGEALADFFRIQTSTQILFYLLIAIGYHLLAHLVHVHAQMDEIERQRERNAALETQRMRALRRFAGGIAHELNNVLTTLSGHLSLMRMARTEEEREASAGDIDGSLERIVRLGHQLLSMGMGRPFQSRTFAVNPVVQQVVAQLAGKTSKPVGVDAPSQVDAAGDPELLRDILLGLALMLDTQPRDSAATVIRVRGETMKAGDDGGPAAPRCHILIENPAARLEAAEDVREPGLVVRQGRVTLDLTLAAADALATQMGGALHVRNGTGTTIDISLPTVP